MHPTNYKHISEVTRVDEKRWVLHPRKLFAPPIIVGMPKTLSPTIPTPHTPFYRISLDSIIVPHSFVTAIRLHNCIQPARIMERKKCFWYQFAGWFRKGIV